MYTNVSVLATHGTQVEWSDTGSDAAISTKNNKMYRDIHGHQAKNLSNTPAYSQAIQKETSSYTSTNSLFFPAMKEILGENVMELPDRNCKLQMSVLCDMEKAIQSESTTDYETGGENPTSFAESISQFLAGSDPWSPFTQRNSTTTASNTTIDRLTNNCHCGKEPFLDSLQAQYSTSQSSSARFRRTSRTTSALDPRASAMPTYRSAATTG